MQHGIRHALRMALLFLIALSLGGRPPVEAQGGPNALLNGTYTFSTFGSCMQATSIDDTTKALDAPGAPRTRVSAGTMTFNGDGTGTISGTSHNLFLPSINVGNVPVSTSAFTGTFDYAVNADGSFTLTNIVNTGTVQDGPQAGLNFRITRAGPVQGQILERGQFLALSDVNLDVEKLDLDVDSTIDRERICNRSGFAGKLPGLSTGSPTVYIPHFDTTTEQWATGVAVANVGTASTMATVEAFDPSGTSLGTTTAMIPANGRIAFDVGSTFGAGTGSLKITADQPVVALEVFTNLQSSAIAGLPGLSTGSPTVIIPHFDTTTEEWATGVAVANVGTASTMATVEAFDPSGTSLGTTTAMIPANGRIAFDVGATFGAGSGWLKITADQPVVALEVFTNLQSSAIAGLPGQ